MIESRESVALPADGGIKDEQTVTADGRDVKPMIDGVLLRPATTQADGRGDVVELLSEGWGEVGGDHMPYAYAATIQPGVIKGWVCHLLQADRITHLIGRIRWVLYDGREDSATAGVIQHVTLTERNRHLIVVPAGVWHAAQNVGTQEAMFVNLPTRAYDHADPDKHRLPWDTTEIPFRFDRPR